MALISCISFDSYIKPQQSRADSNFPSVVYLLIPTSNHNSQIERKPMSELYIFWFLHQTTTPEIGTNPKSVLYIFWFLHQTTTCLHLFTLLLELYIFWFLHQTTTLEALRLMPACCISFDSYIKPQPHININMKSKCCISFDSYIKPQLIPATTVLKKVVYLLIPTSNHN